MGEQEAILEVLYGFEKAGLIARDPDKVLSYFSEEIVGTGMGDQGLVTSLQEVSNSMHTTVKGDPEADVYAGHYGYHYPAS